MPHRCEQINCKHESVKYCPHCQKCYCEKCGKEWPEMECNQYPWSSVSYPEMPWTIRYTQDPQDNTGTPMPPGATTICEHSR